MFFVFFQFFANTQDCAFVVQIKKSYHHIDIIIHCLSQLNVNRPYWYSVNRVTEYIDKIWWCSTDAVCRAVWFRTRHVAGTGQLSREPAHVTGSLWEPISTVPNSEEPSESGAGVSVVTRRHAQRPHGVLVCKVSRQCNKVMLMLLLS